MLCSLLDFPWWISHQMHRIKCYGCILMLLGSVREFVDHVERQMLTLLTCWSKIDSNKDLNSLQTKFSKYEDSFSNFIILNSSTESPKRNKTLGSHNIKEQQNPDTMGINSIKSVSVFPSSDSADMEIDGVP